MGTIKWLDVFDTGILFIDKDHKQLVEIINTIQESHRTGNIRDCRVALGSFLDKAKAHFHREEQFLSAISYSGFNDHARQHRQLIELVIELLNKLQPDPETGEEPVLAPDLIEDTLYLLLEDVIKADAEFKTLTD